MVPWAGRLWIRLLPHALWAQVLGVAVTTAGLGFAVWARIYLGSNWSGIAMVKVGHELIRTGPYRWVRHPIYSGLILALAGTAITVGRLQTFLGPPILYLGFKYKSLIEERLMTETFGNAYEEYRQTTGAIVPRFH
jgi:protein-S-isoprenylcysteine O-methyltransferase Ste14